MRKYTFELKIEEGYDEFWEDIATSDLGDGVSKIIAALKDALEHHGFESKIRPMKVVIDYENPVEHL